MIRVHSTDAAIQAAQLAFIRAERLAQRQQPTAFRSATGAASERQLQLTALAEQLADAALEVLQVLPAYLVATDQAKEELCHITEHAIRTGAGCDLAALSAIEDLVARRYDGRLPVAGWRSTGLCRWMVRRNGQPVVWPLVVPAEAAGWSEVEDPCSLPLGGTHVAEAPRVPE